jgi:methyl-accepting chemotaxis protein
MVGDVITETIGRVKGSFSLQLFALFGVMLLVIGGFGGLIYVETAGALENDVETDLKHATSVQAGLISQWIGHGTDHVRSIVFDPAVQSGETDRIETYLERQRDGGPEGTVATHYVTDDGTVLATNGEGSDAGYANVSWWSKSVGELANGVQGPYVDPRAGVRAVAFVGPVPGSDARVVTVVDLSKVSWGLQSPSSVEDSYITIVDRPGVLLTTYQGEHSKASVGPSFSDSEQATLRDVRSSTMALETGETGLRTVDLNGQATATGYTRIRGTDSALLVHVPKQQALALQQEITRLVIGLLVVSLLGLGITGIVVTRSTSGSIQRLAETAEALESGQLDVELETSRTDEIGQLYDAFDSMRRSLKESLEETEEARESAEDQRKELSRLVDSLQTQASEFADITAMTANGDLTQRMEIDSESEAMEQIAREFNEMVAEIESTIVEISHFADEVTAHGQEVTASSEEVKRASEQVTESVQTISEKAERQHEQFQTVTEQMDEMTETTEEIASLCDQVSTIAEQTASTGQRGREAADQAKTAMTRIDDGADRAVSEIRALRDQMHEVEEIAEVISQLAEQTNMIALNANIEASRSDGGGDDSGFAAVAEEVKEMASDTKESAEEIETIIDELREQTTSVATEVEDVQSVIDDNTTTVQYATDALDEIAEYAEQTYTGVQEISTASQQQAAVSQEVLSMVEEAADLSEEVDDEASTVAAAAEEQTSALTEVTGSASELAERARLLRSHLDAFRFEEAPKQIPATDD